MADLARPQPARASGVSPAHQVRAVTRPQGQVVAVPVRRSRVLALSAMVGLAGVFPAVAAEADEAAVTLEAPEVGDAAVTAEAADDGEAAVTAEAAAEAEAEVRAGETPGPTADTTFHGGLTEAKVIRLAVSRGTAVALLRAEAGFVESIEDGVGLYPNPVVEWGHEQFPGDAVEAEVEDLMVVSVPVDLSGRRGAASAIVRFEAERALARASRGQSELVVAALTAYYRALSAARRVEVAQESVAFFHKAADFIRRKKAEGTVSGHMHGRVHVEAELARSELHSSELDAQVARLELGLAIGLDVEQVVFSSDTASWIESSQRPTRAHELQAKEGPPDWQGRRSLQRSRSAVRASGEAVSSANWAWVPEIALVAGASQRTTNETRWGFVMGAELEVPLFDYGQGSTAIAGAAKRLAKAELAAAEQQAKTELVRAQFTLRAVVEEQARFSEAASVASERLMEVANIAYLEGHLTPGELIRARRSRARVQLRELDLALTRKMAEIRLRAARGEFEWDAKRQ